ncbi:MAG: Calx-beta domain-containing protein [Planctomycetaceae bacterium]|nr:Calx-beta domain-containing protein [Planctomycetaceae bacterium]
MKLNALLLLALGLVQLSDALGVTPRCSAAPPQLLLPSFPTAVEGDGGTKDFELTVSLSAPAPSQVTVNFATSDIFDTQAATAGVDYVSAVGTLTFKKGQTAKKVIIQIKGDVARELSEQFAFQLLNPVGATFGPAGGIVYVSISDNDPVPQLQLPTLQVAEGNSGAANIKYTVRLTNPTRYAAKVKYRTRDASAKSGSDYVASSGELQFAPFQLEQQVALQIIGDKTKEPLFAENFVIEFFEGTSVQVGTGIGTVVIVEND